jgi:class 3 adenylate cyclase
LTQIGSVLVAAGDFEALSKALLEMGLSNTEVEELKQAIEIDNKSFGSRTKKWVVKAASIVGKGGAKAGAAIGTDLLKELLGDGLLAEFGSAVDAVRCAMDVQRGMAKRNAEVPQETRIDFRIGINIGDIILDRGDIFGDGVNVAARLEGVADPGGICVSDDVVKQVQGRVAGDFVYVGEHQLKNIARAVRVYRVALDEAIAKRAPSVPYMPPTAVGRAQSADRPPSREAGKSSPADQQSGDARLLLGYAVVPIVTLLLAHYLFVMKLDLNTSYFQVFALAFPALVGSALVWHAGRGLGTTVLLGVAIGIISVFGMFAIVGLVDSTPILPSSRFEWQEAIEYAAGIALSTVVGGALARSINAARAAMRGR